MNVTANTTLPTPPELSYCGPGLDHFHATYRGVHGYVSLLVCVFGSVANVLNIAVLTRREMTSPTNAILTGLAVADLLVMIEYIPFACHMYLPQRPKRERYSYGWALFVLLHAQVSQVFHTISIWLTVTLAVWRYIAVAHPQRNREWCGMQRTLAAIAAGYICCPLLCIPLYLAFEIEPKIALLGEDGNDAMPNSTTGQNTTLYVVDLSEMGKANNNLLMDVNFWVYSVVIKIIPCIALTVLSLRLICALLDTKRRREMLTSSSSRKSTRVMEKERQTDRTTKMLLAVLLLFLLTEFPQGILGVLSVVLGQRFFRDCYNKLGEVMDILALINSAINFILYCAMSRQFRTTFTVMFRPRWMPVPQVDANGHNNHTTTQVTQV
ncbi:G-protein coupled receptor dmsr-1-like [Macrosteles quadrilineatus]|uniref:G-protein coupled receptor dmsr-1-like n=1 Tax=Macrosteles quadrilineatus TaxID=74068 RepID=UPI0023E253CD|nr:G-protein coupled receptor dmsr-1-like [Macrosteles quadrilineatus]XP_054262527.1 G-protein coupled receptor dmsr-1-like [Macrosteles quadrilineatus]